MIKTKASVYSPFAAEYLEEKQIDTISFASTRVESKSKSNFPVLTFMQQRLPSLNLPRAILVFLLTFSLTLNLSHVVFLFFRVLSNALIRDLFGKASRKEIFQYRSTTLVFRAIAEILTCILSRACRLDDILNIVARSLPNLRDPDVALVPRSELVFAKARALRRPWDVPLSPNSEIMLGVSSSSSMIIISRGEARPLDPRPEELRGDMRADRLVEHVRVAPFLPLFDNEVLDLEEQRLVRWVEPTSTSVVVTRFS